MWTAEAQKFLVELAQSKRVWTAPHGTVTTMWDSIAEHVTQRDGGRVPATGRGCREKFELLCKEAKAKQQSASERSGDSESWNPVDQMLFECNDEIAAYIAASQHAKEKEEKVAAERTQRQTELKEETMQTLSQRQSRKRRGSVSSSDSATVSASDIADDSEDREPEQRKRKRTDVRSLVKQSVELNRAHFAAQEAALQEQLAMQREQLAAANEYNKTIDKHMGESNSLFARMIAKM